MLLSNTAAAGGVLTPWSFCLVQYLWVCRVPEGAGNSATRGGMGRELVVLLHAGTHVEVPQGVICTPAHEAASCTWSWSQFCQQSGDLPWAFSPLCLSAYSPFGPSDTSSCSPSVAVLQEGAACSVCLSSDLCKCSKWLFIPPSYNCAFPQGEMPAPNVPHATTGLVTCCRPFGDTCRIPPVVQIAEASTAVCRALKASAGFFTCISWSCKTEFFANQDAHHSQGMCMQEKTSVLALLLWACQPMQQLCADPNLSTSCSILQARVCPVSVHRPCRTGCLGVHAAHHRFACCVDIPSTQPERTATSG